MLKRRRILGSNLGGVRTSAGFGLYGDGSDGNVIISGGETTLSRDMYYNKLTIRPDGILNANAYRIFVKNTLWVESGGSIHANGQNGFTDGSQPAGSLTGTMGVGGVGGYGGLGPDAAPFDNNGQGGTATTSSIGASGGAGGAGSFGLPGSGAIVSALAASTGSSKQGGVFFATMRGTVLTSYAVRAAGGGGGGGGSADNTNAAASGGCGGNVLLIFAKYLRGFSNGFLTANGGNGGDAVKGSDCGGGGGGGGGGLILHTESPYSSFSALTITANGGGGGQNSDAPFRNGANGSNGNVFILTGDLDAP